MPTIRIDKDVYEWLKSQAVPFEDSPNSVLRKLAGLGSPQNDEKIQPPRSEPDMTSPIKPLPLPKKRLTGTYLKDLWQVDVKHALYHWEGTYYENLRKFPGALFDIKGYVIFNTEEEYNRSPYLNIGQKLNVRDGISSIPGYKRMR